MKSQVLQKRIRFTFAADGGAEAVAGINGRLVRKWQKFIVNRPEQLLLRAAPQVPAPDAALKESVAGKDTSMLSGEVKRKAARRVPRRVQDLQRKRSPSQPVAFL